MPKKSEDNGAGVWILETGRPFAEYEDPLKDANFAEITRIFEESGSIGLEEKFPNLAKKLGILTPEKLRTEQHCTKATKRYRADADGTFDEIDNEADAIYLFKAYAALDPKTHFNKHGNPMPASLKRDLETAKKEQNEIQALIMKGGLGSR